MPAPLRQSALSHEERLLWAQLLLIVQLMEQVEQRVMTLLLQRGIALPDWTNRTIKQDPPGWNGMSFAGMMFSQCPAPYLTHYAEQLRSFSRQEERRGHFSRAAQARQIAVHADAWAAWRANAEAERDAETSSFRGLRIASLSVIATRLRGSSHKT